MMQESIHQPTRLLGVGNMSDSKKTGSRYGWIVVLAAILLGFVPYFYFRPHAASKDELVGEWSCVSRPWTFVFATDGQLTMATTGSPQAGKYEVYTKGNLLVVMNDGKRIEANVTIASNGELTLKESDGTESSFKRSASSVPPQPQPPSRPSIVGRWQAIQGSMVWNYETIQFNADGTLVLSAPGELIPADGQYAPLGTDLSCVVNMPGGARPIRHRVLEITDSRLALQGVGTGPSPSAILYWRTDNDLAFRKRLAGAWKNGNEVLTITEDGVLKTESTNEIKWTAYRVVGNDIEVAQMILPDSFRPVRLRVIVSDGQLSLISVDGSHQEYTRLK
jgi:hypothetical protein